MIEERLASMGITLPEPPEPAGSYTPTVRVGDLVFVSGQIPVRDGKVVFAGRVTKENLEDARNAARLCAVNILAQLKRETGNLDRVKKIVRLSGFVNSGPDFAMHPSVIDGASDLIYGVFGPPGRHARAAVGVSSLPLDSMTEVDAIAQVE